jgi:hypothetical protein
MLAEGRLKISAGKCSASLEKRKMHIKGTLVHSQQIGKTFLKSDNICSEHLGKQSLPSAKGMEIDTVTLEKILIYFLMLKLCLL